MPVDYDALAKQAGAVSSQPAQPDYDALAKQAGAVSSTPAFLAPGTSDDDIIRGLGADPALIKASPRYQTNVKQRGSGLAFMLTDPNRTDLMAKLADSPIGDLGEGVRRNLAGVGQLASHVMNKLGLVEDADTAYVDLATRLMHEDYLHNIRHGNGNRTVEMVGGLLTPVPGGKLITGKGVAAAVARGAVVGGAAGAMGPVESGGDYWAEKSKQVAAGGAIGSVLGGAAGALESRAASRASATNGLNPFEKDLVEYADRKNIPIPLSVRTGSQLAHDLEGIESHSVGGSGVAKAARRATSEALTREGEQMAGDVYASPVAPEQAGEGVFAAVKRDVVSLSQKADQEYKPFHEAAQNPANARDVQVAVDKEGQPIFERMGAPIDMEPYQQALKPFLNRFTHAMAKTERNASPGVAALEEIVNGPRWKPIDTAEMDLSALKAAARSEMPQLRDVSQGLAAQAVKQLQTAIDQEAARLGVRDAVRAGRRATAEKFDSIDLLNTLRSGKPIDQVEPVQVYQMLTWGRDAGIQRLREVAKRAPDELPKIGRAYLQGLLDTATREGDFDKVRTVLNKWNELGPQTKLLLFRNPSLVSDLDKFFGLAKKIAANPNPSGSGYVANLTATGMLLATQPHVGVGYIIGNNALSRMLYNPSASRSLAKLMQMKPGPAAESVVLQLMKTYGNNIVPIEAGAARAVTYPGRKPSALPAQ
ncbi:MAG: hypothetical protein M1541_19870 [Acidobacteria bacterium]|nr:hypothetical protein [Acidobacteriota bacterium]